MAEIWGAAIAAAGAIGGGLLASQGAKDAAAASGAGSAAAIAEQARQYNTTRADTAPYRAIGTQAINALGSIYGYKPAATPQSFEEWKIANPLPPELIGKDGRVKTGGGGGGLGGTSILQATDPLGLYSGGGQSWERALDPIGLFGGGPKKPKGPTPESVLQTAYQQYLQNFNYMPSSGNALSLPSSAPKTPPNGIDASSGNSIGAGGSIGQVATVSGQPNDTAIGPPMMAGPDYSNFFASPDYQFRRDQGTRGIERTASARGLTGSGNALAALADYNSNLAASEFGNYFNRQAALAGIGQTAVNTSTGAGINAANNTSAYLQNQADARASGIADSANAWGNALGTIGGIAYDQWGRPKKGG